MPQRYQRISYDPITGLPKVYNFNIRNGRVPLTDDFLNQIPKVKEMSADVPEDLSAGAGSVVDFNKVAEGQDILNEESGQLPVEQIIDDLNPDRSAETFVKGDPLKDLQTIESEVMSAPKREFDRDFSIAGALLNPADEDDPQGQAVNQGLLSRAITGEGFTPPESAIAEGVIPHQPGEGFGAGLSRGILKGATGLATDPAMATGNLGRAGNLGMAGLGLKSAVPQGMEALESLNEEGFSSGTAEKLAEAGIGGALAYQGAKGALHSQPMDIGHEFSTPTFKGGLEAIEKSLGDVNTDPTDAQFTMPKKYLGPPMDQELNPEWAKRNKDYKFLFDPEFGGIKLFHATRNKTFPLNNDKFIGMHAGTEKAALDRADQTAGGDSPADLYELDADFSKPYDFMGEPWSDTDANNIGEFRRQQLKEAGYDHIPYKNAVEDVGSLSHVILDPTKVKILDKTRYLPRYSNALEPIDPIGHTWNVETGKHDPIYSDEIPTDSEFQKVSKMVGPKKILQDIPEPTAKENPWWKGAVKEKNAKATEWEVFDPTSGDVISTHASKAEAQAASYKIPGSDYDIATDGSVAKVDDLSDFDKNPQDYTGEPRVPTQEELKMYNDPFLKQYGVTGDEASQVLKLNKAGAATEQISKELNVAKSAINHILDTYKYGTGDYKTGDQPSAIKELEDWLANNPLDKKWDLLDEDVSFDPGDPHTSETGALGPGKKPNIKYKGKSVEVTPEMDAQFQAIDAEIAKGVEAGGDQAELTKAAMVKVKAILEAQTKGSTYDDVIGELESLATETGTDVSKKSYDATFSGMPVKVTGESGSKVTIKMRDGSETEIDKTRLDEFKPGKAEPKIKTQTNNIAEEDPINLGDDIGPEPSINDFVKKGKKGKKAKEEDLMFTKEDLIDPKKEKKPLSKWRKFLSATGIAKSIPASFDISAPMRQGIIPTLAHPIKAAENYLDSIKNMTGKNWAKHEKDLENDPDFEEMRDHQLLSDPEGKMGYKEEAFISEFTKNLPGIKHSERAYTSYLNSARLQAWKRGKQVIGENPSKEDLKALARVVRGFTGRGELGRLETFAPELNALMWSPSFMASRVQIPMRLMEKGGAGKFARKEFARAAGSLGLILGLAAAAGLEIDTENYRIKDGKYVWDPFGGMGKHAKFVRQMVEDVIKHGKGDRNTHLFERTKRYGRSTLAPIPSTAVDWWEGSNYNGEPFDRMKDIPLTDFQVPGELTEKLTPMGLGDAWEGWEEGGLPGLARSAVSPLTGVGFSVWKNRRRQKSSGVQP